MAKQPGIPLAFLSLAFSLEIAVTSHKYVCSSKLVSYKVCWHLPTCNCCNYHILFYKTFGYTNIYHSKSHLEAVNIVHKHLVDCLVDQCHSLYSDCSLYTHYSGLRRCLQYFCTLHNWRKSIVIQWKTNKYKNHILYWVVHGKQTDLKNVCSVSFKHRQFLQKLR